MFYIPSPLSLRSVLGENVAFTIENYFLCGNGKHWIWYQGNSSSFICSIEQHTTSGDATCVIGLDDCSPDFWRKPASADLTVRHSFNYENNYDLYELSRKFDPASSGVVLPNITYF